MKTCENCAKYWACAEYSFWNDTKLKPCNDWRAVKMTKSELKELRTLKFDADVIQDAITEIRAVLEAVTSAPSGMPGAKGKDDKMARLVAETIELENKLTKLQKERLLKISKLMEWVTQLEDPIAKNIIIDRYVNARSWASVAMRVGISPDAARMIADRTAKKN